MEWIKKGFIYKAEDEFDWWKSHTMAPAAIMLDEKIVRIYMGCWDKEGISRIGYIDVDKDNPSVVLKKSSQPVLDIGDDGCFDDNGVFPGHVIKLEDKVLLYYTGFQKLDKIAFSNFGGLAISYDGGETFERVSKAPVMDRADEGLFTRAGTSVIYEDGIYKGCYSVGSGWTFIENKDRPVYHVNYIESEDGINFPSEGKRIVSCNLEIEHGLGRPQLVKLKDNYYVFYTRRMLDYKYHMGVAKSEDLINWYRIDEVLDEIKHGEIGEFDSDMVYFPCVLDTGEEVLLFYCGNRYGGEGIGYAKLKSL